jgi:hypothetical protein
MPGPGEKPENQAGKMTTLASPAVSFLERRVKAKK